MKKILALMLTLVIITISVFSVSASGYGITFKAEENANGLIECTVTVNGPITNLMGFSTCIAFDDAVVAPAKSDGTVLHTYTGEESWESVMNFDTKLSYAGYVTFLNGAAAFTDINVGEIIINGTGMKEMGLPSFYTIGLQTQVGKITLPTSDDKMDIFKFYFKKLSGKTIAANTFSFTDANGGNLLTADSVADSDSTNFAIGTITPYAPAAPVVIDAGTPANTVIPALDPVTYPDPALDPANTTSVTVSGTATNLGTVSCGIRLDGKTFYPAYTGNFSNNSGALLRDGKFAVVLKGIGSSVLAAGSHTVQPVSFDGTTYTNVGAAFTFTK